MRDRESLKQRDGADMLGTNRMPDIVRRRRIAGASRLRRQIQEHEFDGPEARLMMAVTRQ